MRPFIAIWRGHRDALVAADADATRPVVWFPKAPGHDRWELHSRNGLPPAGVVVTISSAMETRWDNTRSRGTMKRVVYLRGPGGDAPIECRTEVFLAHPGEEVPFGAFPVHHPSDGIPDFWTLYRFRLFNPERAPTWERVEREQRDPYQHWVDDPISRYENMAGEDDGKVYAGGGSVYQRGLLR